MHSKRMQTVQPESIFRFRCILIKQFHYWSQGGSCPTPVSKHASHDAMMLPKATWAAKKNLLLTDYCCFNIRLRRWRWRTGWRSWTKWFWCWEGVSPAARRLAFACAWASPDHIWIVFLPTTKTIEAFWCNVRRLADLCIQLGFPCTVVSLPRPLFLRQGLQSWKSLTTWPVFLCCRIAASTISFIEQSPQKKTNKDTDTICRYTEERHRPQIYFLIHIFIHKYLISSLASIDD